MRRSVVLHLGWFSGWEGTGVADRHFLSLSAIFHRYILCHEYNSIKINAIPCEFRCRLTYNQQSS